MSAADGLTTDGLRALVDAEVEKKPNLQEVAERTFVECCGLHRVIQAGEMYDPCFGCSVESRAAFLDAAVEEYGRALNDAVENLTDAYDQAGI